MYLTDKFKGLRFVGVAALTLIFLLLGTAGSRGEAGVAPPLKIGFIFVGPISDKTWNYTHNQGRLFVESKLSNKVQTTFAENVPESAEAERVMERMIAQGARLIFATSYGYLEPVLHVAARHPEVKFLQVNRFENRKNLGTFFFLDFEPMYAAGVVAGRLTKTNQIGFVGLQPVPQLLQEINALALGARSVNPKAKVRVIWTNNWNDAPTETEVARTLIEGGADTIAFYRMALAKTVDARGAYIIGCDSDFRSLSGQHWLTGTLIDWGPFYASVAQAVLDGTWKSGISVCGAQGGNVKLASFGSAVPKKVQDEAHAIMQKVETGNLAIFEGPLKDRDGNERLHAGERPDVKWLFSMDFFVPGVEGNLPKK
jgi:basic membrane lipoprotein Med (substrate-binding protein (PBP1-ABC) superfamily)